ncbi:4-pyridoxate dehydrogenase-like [Haemaphysalis longicornis]
MGALKATLSVFLLEMFVCMASKDASSVGSENGEAVVSEQASTTEKPFDECYDFVVVGAGSAGSVVANRLSANGTYSVLLLEAGGEETLDLQVPFMAPFLANASNSWEYYTLPQQNACFSYPYNVSRMTQGKILGGTSSINSMSFVRGNQKDFDSWEKDYNATGWKYSDVLEYFKKIEMFNISDFEEQEDVDKYHGKTGETPVNYPNYFTPLSDVFLNACEQAGYKYIDYNGESQLGFSRVQSNTAGGARMSANKCFLQSIKENRTNLRISTYSEAKKIHFVDENGRKRARAVEFTVNGTRKNVSIGYEVVVCAGAIGSPKLLMLSGIGPELLLKSLNISVIADLQVGQGLQDHVVFLGLVVTTTKDMLHLSDLANKSREIYRYNQTGLLALPGAYEAFIFSSHENKTSPDTHPDIQMALTAVFPDHSINKSGYIPQDIYDQYYAPMFNKTGFMTTLTLVQPNSRGFVMLNTTDVNGPPYIDPKMLSVEDDINRTIKGIQNMRRVFETEAMKGIGGEVYNVPFPRCKEYEDIWSYNYLKCFLQNAGFAGMHVCCTCAMGNNTMSVVDERLRVRGGVKGVRVADASVMPKITSGNTHAVIMMIGAKAADMIIADYKAAKEAERNKIIKS